jgi:hypothetical protein
MKTSSKLFFNLVILAFFFSCQKAPMPGPPPPPQHQDTAQQIIYNPAAQINVTPTGKVTAWATEAHYILFWRTDTGDTINIYQGTGYYSNTLTSPNNRKVTLELHTQPYLAQQPVYRLNPEDRTQNLLMQVPLSLTVERGALRISPSR